MTYRWPLLISLMALCLGLVSCSSMPADLNFGTNLRELKLNITEEKKGRPKFSFAADSSPKTPEIYRLDVNKVDDKGLRLQSAWSIQKLSTPGAASTLTAFEYGKVPTGWKETCPAVPIQDNLFYSINGVKYFCRDSQGTYSIYSQADFDKLQPQSKMPGQ